MVLLSPALSSCCRKDHSPQNGWLVLQSEYARAGGSSMKQEQFICLAGMAVGGIVWLRNNPCFCVRLSGGH